MKKIVMALVLLGLAQGVQAQDEKSQIAVPANENVENVRLATRLAKYGYANYSALSLIEAASILSRVDTEALKPDSYQKGEGESTDKTFKAEITVEQLLKDAREYADGDATLLALANSIDVPKTSVRGAVGGAKRHTDLVKAHSTDVYHIKFYAGRTAEIFVSGDGDSDLDLYVYDENGNLIKKDIDYSDDCYVSWTPKWTGSFTVKIVNRGNICNRYTLWTN